MISLQNDNYINLPSFHQIKVMKKVDKNQPVRERLSQELRLNQSHLHFANSTSLKCSNSLSPVRNFIPL